MSKRTPLSTPALALLVGLVLAAATACGGPNNSEEGKGDLIPSEGASTPAADVTVDMSAPTADVVTVADPVDNAFTVNVPEGWDSVAYSAGGFYDARYMVSSVSPDGKTVLFLGDPKLPLYWNPETVSPENADMASKLDTWEVAAYQPAETYFPDYVNRKFGELPGFEITSVESQPEVTQALQQAADAGGYPSVLRVVEVRFEYIASDEPIHALVTGITQDSGPFWTANVSGLATNREADDYKPMVNAIFNSLMPTDDYIARANAYHNDQMAQIQAFGEELTRQHNANMAWIQQSASAHQSRMEAIWAQGDASMQNYYNRMDSMDHTQRDFLNYINEEETVSGGSTGTRQVATGATNYWVNKNDGTYVGGDVNFGDTQLRALGLNPNDYEQVTVVK